MKTKPLTFPVFTFILCGTVCSEGINKPHNAVQTLTEQNFEAALSDEANGLWLLKFYAPWCGHCKKLAPVLNKVAPYMEGKMAIGKIDCTTEQALCQRFEVRGYPTLKIYRDGDFIDFPGERTADSMIEFGEKMAADAVEPVSSHRAALDDLAGKEDNNDRIAFVAYDPSASGDTIEAMLQSTTLLQVYKQVARKQQAFATFGFVTPDTAEEEIEKFGAGDKAFIAKIEEDVDPEIFEVEEELTSPSLLQFVKENNRALVTALGSHNFRMVGMLGKRMVIGVINPDNKAETEAFLADIKKVAISKTDLASNFNFCSMDGKKWERFLKQFNIKSKELPQVFVLDYPNRDFWHDPEVSGLNALLEGVISGEIIAQKQENKGSDDMMTLIITYMPIVVIVVMILFFIFACFVFQDDEVIEENSVRAEGEGSESTNGNDDDATNDGDTKKDN